jgi:Asp/Glu/hydantoin racemase
MAKRKITLIHASQASLAPLNGYYPKEAPELDITNLLDDGVMKLFRSGEMRIATRRLADMIATGRDVYGADLALLSCSAVTRPALEELRAGAGIPLLKIDGPMARLAVTAGRRIGVIVTFPPTQAVTRELLEDAAAGKPLEIVDELIPEAVEAILAGDQATHDQLLTAAAGRLAEKQVDAIVLAQVSMAHLVPVLKERTRLPVFSSLETSLVEVRRMLGI